MLKAVKQSPAHHRLQASGATFVETSGWLSAAHFGDPSREAEAVRASAGLCDLNTRSKWRAEGTALVPFLTGLLGSQPPEPGRVAPYQDSLVCRLGPDEAMFLFDAEGSSLIDKLREQGKTSGCLHTLDRTSGFGLFLLSGPKARSVLQKLTPVDMRDRVFPNLSCTWGLTAAAPALLVRRDFSGLLSFEILVSREYGDYLWDAVIEAGREFQVNPFGHEAARLLGAS